MWFIDNLHICFQITVITARTTVVAAVFVVKKYESLEQKAC